MKKLIISVMAFVLSATQVFAEITPGPWTNYDFGQAMNESILADDNVAVEELCATDFSGVNMGTNEITINIDETDVHTLEYNTLGVQVEFADNYATFFENEELRPEFLEYMDKTFDIPVFRWGGTTINTVNLWTQTGPYETREGAQDINYPGYEGTEKGRSPMKMGIPEYLKMAYANNPDAQIIPCVSVYVMTKEDISKLAHYLYDDPDESEYGAKRAADGVPQVTKVAYWEMSNEIDYAKGGHGTTDMTYTDWYCKMVRDFTEEIRKVEPDAKVLSCGPSAPWGDKAYKSPPDSMDSWRWWFRNVMNRVADIVDGTSWHPYYDGYPVEFNMYFTKEMKKEMDAIVAEKDIRDENGELKDLKIYSTESSRFYVPGDAYPGSVTYDAAISASHYLNLTFNNDANVGSAYHNLLGYDLWAFWSNKNGEWLESPVQKAYKLYEKCLGERRLGMELDIVENGERYLMYDGSRFAEDMDDPNYFPDRFSLVATATGKDEVQIILLNKEPYKDANVTINFNEELGNSYTLVEETVLSAPNIGTWAYNAKCADMVTLTTTEKNEPNFKTYHMKGGTLVGLRLKTDGELPLGAGEEIGGSGEEQADMSDSFEDTMHHWAGREITLMKNHGFISGTGDNKFTPDKPVSRAEFAVMAYNMLGLSSNILGAGFGDILPNDWYTPYANAMKLNGYMRGTYFDPYGQITLLDMCRIANAIFTDKKAVPEKINVEGITAFSAEDQDAIMTAAGTNAIKGLYENGKGEFGKAATRAEAAVILYNLYSAIQ